MVPQHLFDDPARLRYAVGIFVLLAVMLFELLRPHRAAARGGRWWANIAIFAAAGALESIIPFGMATAALWAHAQGIGFLNQVDLPDPLRLVLGVVALDAALYGQHRVMHTFEPLWRLHRVHHTDPEFDVTTALRFHPLELPVTLALMCAAVLVAGPSVLAVALFSVIKVAMSLIEHANFSLPRRLDRALRRLLVTPDVHRVHHSVHYDEGNSNFGTIFSLWDRLCGSYCDRPRAAGAAMRFGVTGLDDGLREQTLRRLLSQPWLRVESQGHPQAGHLKAGALKAAAGHEPADDILARAEESR